MFGVKNAGSIMRRIENIFKLEQILEVIEINKSKNILLDNINKLFSNNLFDLDYVMLEKMRQKIGEIGENYVYECEKNRLLLLNSPYAEKVDNSPSKDPKLGYDILSYTEEGVPIYIEVKSTVGDLDTPFFLTKHEENVAKKIRENHGIYQIHRVYNVGGKMKIEIYNDFNQFHFEETVYRVTFK